MRIGFGYDVHRLEAGRDLILGGVPIPFEKGIVAHSDGDVLIHALCDALLGAADLGDIGHHYPDTDPENRNIDSKRILSHTIRLVQDQGYQVANVDATLCLEKPKIGPYISRMKQVLGGIIPAEAISIKATTNEKMGFVGRGEGVAAYAAVLLTKQ